MAVKDTTASLSICLLLLSTIGSISATSGTTISIEGDNPVNEGDRVIILCQCVKNRACLPEVSYFSVGGTVYSHSAFGDQGLPQYDQGDSGSSGLSNSWYQIVLLSASASNDGTTYQCTMGNTGWDNTNNVTLRVNAGGYSMISSTAAVPLQNSAAIQAATTSELPAVTSHAGPSIATTRQQPEQQNFKTQVISHHVFATSQIAASPSYESIRDELPHLTLPTTQVTIQSAYSEAIASTPPHITTSMSAATSSLPANSPRATLMTDDPTSDPPTVQTSSAAATKSNGHVTVSRESVTSSTQDDAPTYVYVAVGSGVGIVVYVLTIVLIGLVISLKIKARKSRQAANTTRSDRTSVTANWDSYTGANTNLGSAPMVPMVSNPVYSEVMTPMSPAPPYFKEDPSLFEGRQVVVNLDSRYHDVPQRKSAAVESLYDYIDMQ